MSAIRCGLAGTGYWGANLLRNIDALGMLAGTYDSSPERCAEVRSKYPDAQAFGSFEEMCADRSIDAVVLATPAQTHHRLAMAALRSGKHVFVEKPLALQTSDAREMVETARSQSRVLFVGHVLLHHPGITRMVEFIREGALGDIRHVRTRRVNLGRIRTVEDVWWSFAPHDISVILKIFGGKPTGGAAGFSSYITPGIADFVYAHYTFGGGRSAHIEVSWLDPQKQQSIEVFGSRGVLTFRDSRDRGAALEFTECGTLEDDARGVLTWRHDSVNIPFGPGEPLALELQNFADAAAGKAVPLTDGYHGLQVVETLSMVSPGVVSPAEVLA